MMLKIDRIQERMGELGLNPFSAAKQAGLGQDYVRDLLRGKVKHPSAAKLRDLALTLKCSTEYLLGDSSTPGEPPEAFESPARPVMLKVERVVRRGFNPTAQQPAPKGDRAYWVVSAGYDLEEWLEKVEDSQLGGAIPEGALLHVVRADQFYAGLTQVVIVETMMGEGYFQLVERSVQRIEFMPSGVMLGNSPGYDWNSLISENGITRTIKSNYNEDVEAAEIAHTTRVVGLVLRSYTFFDNGDALDAIPF